MNDKIIFSSNELFRQLCGRDPVQSEIKLFDNIKLSSTSSRQTSVAVSTKYRSDICLNNPHSSEFEKTYQQLHKANLKELDSLVALLHSVKRSPEILQILRHTCLTNVTNQLNQSHSSVDYSKILNKNTNISSSNRTDIPSLSNTLSDCIFLNSDFVDTIPILMPPEMIVPISSLDIPSQEKVLIKDLIYCLMGDHGVYIKALPLTSYERQFDIDATMYSGFLDLVKNILEIVSQLSTVYRFVDEYCKYEHGNINQALANAISLQLKDFRLLICQMEELFYNDNLTLKGMLNYIRESGILIRCMACICEDIIKFKSRGGAVLSMFYHHGLSAGNQKQTSLINNLMRCCTVPFFRMLKIWIYRGIISDPYDEFFIKETVNKATESNISQTYWINIYTVENNLVPRFLENYVEKILHTGKYLNVIQLCDMSSAINIEDEVGPYGDAAFPDVEDMTYEIEEQHFILQIDRAYQYASKLLLNIMFNDRKLKAYLQLMKHFFLLDQADWLSHFMCSAKDELKEKISDCQRSRLESLLEVAIQSTGGIDDHLKDNITIELSNQELMPFIYGIMKYDPLSNKRVVNQNVTSQNLRVLDAFSLKLSTEWPISLVLNNSVIQKYQILFRHLFYCHHVEKVLFRVWSSSRCSRAIQLGNQYIINRASILGNNMRTFIQHLIYYMTTEVIEPFWICFKTKLNQAQNLDEILKFHEEFLHSSLVNCIGPVDMLKGLQKMMVLCINYATRLKRMRTSTRDCKKDSKPYSGRQINTEDVGEIYDAQSFENQINEDEATFAWIAKNLIVAIKNDTDNKMLLKLVDRLEFNGFYDYCYDETSLDNTI